MKRLLIGLMLLSSFTALHAEAAQLCEGLTYCAGQKVINDFGEEMILTTSLKDNLDHGEVYAVGASGKQILWNTYWLAVTKGCRGNASTGDVFCVGDEVLDVFGERARVSGIFHRGGKYQGLITIKGDSWTKHRDVDVGFLKKISSH